MGDKCVSIWFLSEFLTFLKNFDTPLAREHFFRGNWSFGWKGVILGEKLSHAIGVSNKWVWISKKFLKNFPYYQDHSDIFKIPRSRFFDKLDLILTIFLPWISPTLHMKSALFIHFEAKIEYQKSRFWAWYVRPDAQRWLIVLEITSG